MNEITEFFRWASINYNTGGANSFLQSLINQVGQVQSLEFIRDPSNRVKQVKVNGSNGSKVIAGWLFKAVWNDWAWNNSKDYIYSLTFFSNIAQ